MLKGILPDASPFPVQCSICILGININLASTAIAPIALRRLNYVTTQLMSMDGTRFRTFLTVLKALLKGMAR
jgi:hypothetical protein